MRISRIALVLFSLMLLAVPIASATTWTYSTANTTSWTAPAGVNTVYVTIIGGGGSGHGGWIYTYNELSGYGGYPGAIGNHSGVVVSPGTSYPLTVGAGGARDATGGNGAASQSGGSSTIFDFTSNGGVGGMGNPYTDGNGQNGQDGNLAVTGSAENGESVTTYSGGTKGSGYGSGGGGGAANDALNQMGYGGKGGDGVIIITTQASSGANVPDFYASTTAPTSGTVVAFYDNSTITNTTGLTYLWDFGDGYTSSTVGDVNHVYGWNGVFTVKLTVHSADGDPTEEKPEYIIVTTAQTELQLKTAPRDTQYHLQAPDGSAVVGATFTITSLSTSTGGWQWIQDLYGIPIDTVALNDTPMTATSDSLGNVEFITLPSAFYQITVIYGGHTYTTLYNTPHDSSYVIVMDRATPWAIGLLTQGETVGQSPPRTVQFHVQNNLGAKVSGATVTVTGTSTSTGSWDWVQTLFGIPLSSVGLDGTAMSTTTDSLGNCEFLVVPSATYNVVVASGGTTYSTLTIAPHESEYYISFTAGSASSIKFVDMSELVTQSAPKTVQIHVQTNNAVTVTGATVTIQGTSTSTGSWDWVQTLFGIPISTVALNGTSMSATTDSVGNCEFLVLPSAKYNVVVAYGGTTFSTLTLIPHEDKYTVVFTPGSASSVKILDASSFQLTGTPSQVTFHVTTFFGEPIVTATIYVTPVSTSSGDWDWIQQLFNIPIDEISLDSVAMTQTTDSQGDATFLTIPTAKYNVTTVKTGYTFSNPMYVTPNLRTYSIIATTTEEGFSPAVGTSNVSMTVAHAKINSTYGFINVTVLDTTSSITGGNIYIYRLSATPGGAATLVDTMTSVDSDFTDSSIVALNTTGTSFSVNGTMSSSRTPPTIVRVVSVGFDGSPVGVGWLSSRDLFYGSMLLVVGLMLYGGGKNELGITAAGCFIGWILLGIGFLSYYTDIYGGAIIGIALSIASVLVGFAYIANFKRENR